MKRIYLAGPDVFYTHPKWRGDCLKTYLLECDLEGMFPFDNEVEITGDGPADAKTIYQANIKMIYECDGVFANVMNFRGPSCDPGTAFEIGFAKALGKPVVAYGASIGDYKERLKNFKIDPLFPRVEDFGLVDNLMIVCGADAVFNTSIDVRAAVSYLKSLL